MVLFLFVIMLLGVHQDDLLIEVHRRHQVMAVLGAAALAGVLLFAMAGVYTSSASRCGEQAPADVVASADVRPCVGLEDAVAASDTGSVGVVAERMFGRYTFPFEVAGVLLTVATIGAMVLGRRRDLGADEDPAFEPSAEIPDEADLAMALATLEPLQGEQEDRPGTSALVTDDPEVIAAQGDDEPDPMTDEGDA
jgi:NADH:ubiquinone oxidoreductase subunit 6 (subunit J)